MLTRRKFLQMGAAGALIVTAQASVPLFMSRAFAALQPGASAAGGSKAFVVIELAGGNDGLNTVVPFGDPRYYQLRPNIGIPAANTLHLTDELGLHPSLSSLHQMYNRGQVAIVQGVCYPNPNYSHFEASDIWQSAQPGKSANRSGWLGRYLDSTAAGGRQAACLGGESPLTLYTQTTLVPAINGLDDFRFQADDYWYQDGSDRLKVVHQIYKRVAENPVADYVRASAMDALSTADVLASRFQNFKSATGYPESELGRQLSAVVEILATDLDFRIFYVRLDGFDTHTGQLDQQATLLKDLADSLSAFYIDLGNRGMADHVVTMSFSEFGRRPAENGGGTDHGSAQPMFVVGNQLKGGLYGRQPSLSDLDNENLKFNTDFRNVYATLLDNWLGVDSQQILDHKWDHLPIF